MNPTQRFLQTHIHLIECVLFIQATVTGYFCFLGASMLLDADGASWHGRASAAIFAVGITASIFLFWRIALSLIPHLPTLRFRGIAMALVVIGCAGIVGISSWLSVTAQGGAAALQQHMHEGVVAFQAATDSIYERVRRTELLAPDLEVFATRVTAMGKDEFRTGKITGTGGPGGVSDTLQTIGAQASALASQIRQSMARAEGLAAGAREQLGHMREIANRDEPVGRRMVAFAGEAGKLTAVLTELAGQDLSASLHRQISALPNLVTQRVVSRRNAELAETQKQALAEIRLDLERSAAVLAQAAADIAEDPAEPIPLFERLSLTTAVFVHAGSLIPLWLGSLATDLFPAVLVCFFMLMSTIHEWQGEPRNRIDRLTVRDLRDAKAAFKVLQLPPRGPGIGPYDSEDALYANGEDLN